MAKRTSKMDGYIVGPVVDVAPHDGLAAWVAERFLKRFQSVDRAEAMGEARIGLMRAGWYYRPAQGVKFTTYAYPCIYLHLCRWAADLGHVDKVTRSMRANGIAGAKVVSLDTPSATGRTTLGDTIQHCDRGHDRHAEAHGQVAILLRPLTERQRLVVERHFGGESLYAIGRDLGVSGQAVAQMKSTAMRVLIQEVWK